MLELAAIGSGDARLLSAHEPTRDTGLLRTIGDEVLAANIMNGVIGAGIFAVPAVRHWSAFDCGEAGGNRPMAMPQTRNAGGA